MIDGDGGLERRREDGREGVREGLIAAGNRIQKRTLGSQPHVTKIHLIRRECKGRGGTLV